MNFIHICVSLMWISIVTAKCGRIMRTNNAMNFYFNDLSKAMNESLWSKVIK